MNLHIKLSPFLHIIKINKNKYLFYNSLLLKKFICNKEIFDQIKRLNFKNNLKIFNYLHHNRFIINSNLKKEDEIRRYIKKNKIDLSKPTFKVFYIILTTGCNFKCKYCYLSSLINPKARIMNINTAKKTINYISKYIKKVKDEIPKVVLYGGEPLLNFKVMKYIIIKIRERIRKKEIPFVNLILITNGSLITESIAKFLKENKVLVAVSLDGQKDINDMNRIYPQGRGTYQDIIRGIKILNKENINPTISCTINKENVGKLNKIIPWFVKNFKIDSLGLNLFAGGDCSKLIIKKLSLDSSKQIINSFKICRKYGIYEDTVLRQIKAFVKEKPNIYFCAATGREIAIDPEGNIATCPAFLNTKSFPLNIKRDKYPELNQKFINWTKRTPLLNKRCYNCIALGVCGGGCAYNAYKNHKNIYALDNFYCNYAKNITNWMLKEVYNNEFKKYI